MTMKTYHRIEMVDPNNRGVKSKHGDYFTSIVYNCVSDEQFEKDLESAKGIGWEFKVYHYNSREEFQTMGR